MPSSGPARTVEMKLGRPPGIGRLLLVRDGGKDE
jgi:hypothetical protein